MALGSVLVVEHKMGDDSRGEGAMASIFVPYCGTIDVVFQPAIRVGPRTMQLQLFLWSSNFCILYGRGAYEAYY